MRVGVGVRVSVSDVRLMRVSDACDVCSSEAVLDMFQSVLIGCIFDEYRRAHGRLVKQHTVHTVVALTAAFDW